MLTRFRNYPALALLLLGFCGFARPLGASGQATIMSVSFANGDPAIHIGSVITVNMSVIDASTQLSGVSVTAVASTGLTLGSPDLASQITPVLLYVTDGTRTWKVSYPGGGTTSFSISNTNFGTALLDPTAPGWSVADYSTLQNQTFRVYIGTLLTNSAASVTADLGTFGTVVLNDSGTPPDQFSGDGVWSASYTVPDLVATFTGVRLYGHTQYNSLPATNDNFQSPTSFNVDALRPSIGSLKFSVPALPSYNNVLYLSANSQGTPNADPTNSQGRFDLVVNKVNTIVDISIGTSPVKQLASVVIPAGAVTLNGSRVWDGTTGSNPPVFAPDGIYTVNVAIHDNNGVQGLTQTTQVRVVSMRLQMQDIRLSPSGRQVQPAFTNGVITAVQALVTATRDNNGSLRNSLVALNWPAYHPNTNIPITYSGDFVGGSVFCIMETSFLNNAGAVAFGIDPNTSHDQSGDDTDTDAWAVRYQFDTDIGPAGSWCGDGNKSNDWDFVRTVFNIPLNLWNWQIPGLGQSSGVLDELNNVSGPYTDPTELGGYYSENLLGPSPAQGDYRLRMRATLTGMTYDFQTTGPCTAPAHFYPDLVPDPGGGTSNRGLGIYVEDSSLIFSVQANTVPVSDTTPPVFLSSAPIANATIAPGVYGGASGQPLMAQFQDAESGINTSALSTFATLNDPLGNLVGGVSSNDGGGPNNTVTLYFRPASVLTQGGQYTLTLHTCNTAGLCLVKTVAFNVLDETPPSVETVELVPQIGVGTISLSPNQSGPEGPFQNIQEIWVTLSLPGTSSNTIDWADSNVSLYQIVAGTKQAVNMTPLNSGTPTDSKLKYRIDSVINGAGLFEVDTQTFSKDAGGQAFSGPPAGTINPQFTTSVCTSCVTLFYNAPGYNASRPAITGEYPLTVTAGVTAVNPFAIGVDAPSDSVLPADPNWTMLATADHEQSMRFFVAGVIQTTPFTWTYSNKAPVTYAMYYNESDLPTGIKDSDLKVRVYSAGAWSTQTQTVQDTQSNTGCSISWVPTSSQAAGLYYAIRYPSTQAGVNSGGTGTPTPMAFPNTRSFNPNSPNLLNRAARFYYGSVAPKTIDVRVFDTAGRLVRTLGLGQGVNLSDVATDPIYGTTSYFFAWDGTNDSGALAHNGVYLVRWQVTRQDGSSATQVKPVALIK